MQRAIPPPNMFPVVSGVPVYVVVIIQKEAISATGNLAGVWSWKKEIDVTDGQQLCDLCSETFKYNLIW